MPRYIHTKNHGKRQIQLRITAEPQGDSEEKEKKERIPLLTLSHETSEFLGDRG